MPYLCNGEIPPYQKTAVALGNFDGLHIGHMAVIHAAMQAAGQDMVPAVLKFREHPFFASGQSANQPYLLLSEPECEKRLREQGVAVYTYDFSAVRSLSPQAFVTDILARELHATAVSCGYNYRFGKNAAGDAALLRTLCEACGIEVHVCNEIFYQGEPVSSTAIRRALLAGDMQKANGMLGYLYSYDYTVVTGDQRGRLLGAPTINQFFPKEVLVPRYGVYASRVTVADKTYAGVTNIGLRPTIGHSAPRSETYIEGFRGDLYGQNPKVALLQFLRPEIKFDSLEQLSAQIASDAKRAADIVRESQ